MKTILAILLLMIAAACAGEGRRWGHLAWVDDRDISPVPILAWEVQLSVSFVGPWNVLAITYDAQAPLTWLPDGSYWARVRALAGGLGIDSPFCRQIPFSVPAPDPIPPATHIRLTVSSEGQSLTTLNVAMASSQAFFTLSPDGTRLLHSADLMSWQAFGPALPPGSYNLESTLVTLLP